MDADTLAARRLLIVERAKAQQQPKPAPKKRVRRKPSSPTVYRPSEERPCIHCSKPFRASRRNDGTPYCSRRCASLYRWAHSGKKITGVLRPCEYCGTEFAPTSPRVRFCSRRCAALSWKRPKGDGG